MKRIILISTLLSISSFIVVAQTTVTSGNWSDPTVWSGGAIPLPGGTVNVNSPLAIDVSLSPTGAMTFASNATDQPGGTAYTFNPNTGASAVTVNAGATVTFEGGTAGTPNVFSSGTINVYGTLILGYTQLNNSGSLNITIESGGTLIINGNLVNKNNAGTFTVNGALIVNGNFDNQTGSITVGGSGTINTTGTLTSTGGSTIFGTTNDCNTGPCSGTTLACTFTNTISPVSKTICNGSSAGTLTSVNSASSPTYQWLSSTDDITYSNASGVSTNATYVTPALTQTTWYKVRITSSSPCTSISASLKVTVLPAGGWLGATSNDWGTAGNWCANAVPTSTTDVTITNAANISHMPTVNAGTAAACRNLVISNSSPASSLTIAASATASLSIYGDFTNNGSFTDNSTASVAGVILAGSVVQNITGTTANVFNDLTINNTSGASAGVNINSNNIAVNNNLTLTSGVVNLNGYTTTLGTSAASPGTLGYTAGVWFYGGNIQRWFPTTAIILGANASLFPIGTASNYRPIYFGSSGFSAAGGTIKVSHTGITGTTAVSFADGGSTVQVRSNSFWTVTTGNGLSSTGTPLTVRTEATSMGLVWSTSDLRLTLAAAAAPGTAGVNGGTVINPQVNRTGFSVAGLSNNFYWGSINSSQTTLPVALTSFNGRQIAEQTALSWTTPAGSGIQFFSVERSDDGLPYKEIGTVTADGTAAPSYQYGFNDAAPFNGKNYYRLKMVYPDGAVAYSPVILLTWSNPAKLLLFPNPSDGRTLNGAVDFMTSGKYTVAIYNASGMMVGSCTSSQPGFVLRFPNVIPAGIYFARFSTSNDVVVKSFLVRP